MANANGKALLSMINCRAKLLRSASSEDDIQYAVSLMKSLAKRYSNDDRLELFSATDAEHAKKVQDFCDFLGINPEDIAGKINGDTEGHNWHRPTYSIRMSDLQEALRKSAP